MPAMCDCNRQLLFFPEHERDEDEGRCIGAVRYVVARMDPVPDGYDIHEFNEGYPDDARRVAREWAGVAIPAPAEEAN